MGASEILPILHDHRFGPAQEDLDRCVHCGLCLNACPTYRELGVEMDSPRGRIYQMNAIANGEPITPEYIRHMDLCLACRGCETACPSGVPYGRMIEAARSALEPHRRRSPASRLFRKLIFDHVLPSRTALKIAGTGLYLYQASGLQKLVRKTRILNFSPTLAGIEALSPTAEVPFFYRNIGKTFAPKGERRYRVAFLAGCIANITFARLNEATVRVLQQNGCEVVIPGAQNCCGALHLHSGLPAKAERLARNNIDTILEDRFDAVLTNAAGCGSTLKEYDQLLAGDPKYRDKARQFRTLMKDVTEFLGSIDLNRNMGSVNAVVTYQDSCHLAHGQKIKEAPRKLLKLVPGLTYREMPKADLCCGSAGIYNVIENEMAMEILKNKMQSAALTQASVIATANPGCMLQLQAGARLYGNGQRVAHVVEILDEAYRLVGSR